MSDVKPSRRAVKVDPAKLLAPKQTYLEAFGGSKVDAFNETLIHQVGRASFVPGDADAQMATDASCAALIGGKPRDELEGMLIAQMVATHNATMECFRRAALSEQTTERRDANLGHANRLSRSYAALLQTLDKRRNQGQQTVRVEHVHVHAGGQAIVGPVSAGAVAAPVSDDPKALGYAPDLIQGTPAHLMPAGAGGEEGGT